MVRVSNDEVEIVAKHGNVPFDVAMIALQQARGNIGVAIHSLPNCVHYFEKRARECVVREVG